MDIKRKKELLGTYHDRHPEMGVISFRCSATDETFFMPAVDIPAKFNRLRFQLSVGNCPNKRLQELWTQYGEDGFALQTVKRLKYEDPKEDHTEELETLCELYLLENPKAERIWK
ncbi:MAG: GIY-YIG nuclease family protein [Oscillospiraceae bacterium]|nr:GIY-YIG nuclease family protein [Oscillospiraceae bacterium]